MNCVHGNLRPGLEPPLINADTKTNSDLVRPGRQPPRKEIRTGRWCLDESILPAKH
jgi:hypothetical protein